MSSVRKLGSDLAVSFLRMVFEHLMVVVMSKLSICRYVPWSEICLLYSF